MKAKLFGVAALAVVLLAPDRAEAITYQYEYMGAPFTSITSSCSGVHCDLLGITAPLTPVTASVEATWLGDNPSPIGAPASGVVILGGSDMGGFASLAGITFVNGIITSWGLDWHGGQFGFVGSLKTSSDGDSADYTINVAHIGYSAILIKSASGPAGTWTGGPVLVTPLPGALPLFATALGLLGLLRWRSKRKLAPR